MNLMNIGAAFQGGAGGLNAGLDMAAKIAAMRDARRMADARRAVGQAYMAGPAPQPQLSPGPGQSSVPDPGLLQLPSNGAPPVPQAMPANDMGQPPPQAFAPPAAPQIAPPAPMGPPDAADNDPLAGQGLDLSAATEPDPLTAAPLDMPGPGTAQSAQQTIMGIAQQIKAANPDIAPEALFDATQLQIEQMKGVRNDVKDYMTMQVELAKLQQKMQYAEGRWQNNLDVEGMRGESRQAVADTRAGAARDVATTQAGARRDAASMAASSRVSAAGIGAGARTEAARIGATSRENVADVTADSRAYGSDQAYRARVNAERARNGQPETAAPGPAPGSRRKGAATVPKPAASYKSANDVKAAFQAGKIDQATAVKILRTQFGMK